MIKKFTLALLMALFCFEENIAQQLPFTYTYTGKPRFQILTKRNNATLGIINVELYPSIAPRHVRNFDSLVSQIFYDTTAFHRVIPGFVIQGGDPNSRSGPKPTWGYGQPGQPKVKAEFTAAKHLRGRISAARAQDINSATSQFFICHANTPNLDGNYSVYGRVTSGINFVDTIVNAPRDGNDCPLNKIEMFITYIGSNDSVPQVPVLSAPKNDSLEVDTLNPITLKWLHKSDAVIYHCEVSTDSTFATTTFTANTAALSFYIPSGLLGGKKYFWRVNNNTGGDTSVYSPVWRFRTQNPVNDVGIKQNAQDQSKVIVFPNPGAGKFTFSNIEKGNRIEIFDVQGKLIVETVSSDSSAVINLEGKEKGVYTYRITGSKEGTRQGKLVVK